MPYSVSDKKKFVWNMIGSMSNALSSFMLLTIVSRVNGSTDGGIFSLAFSTAQLLASVGCFEERAIQATDVQGKRTFSEYLTFRWITCALMLVCTCLYIWIGKHTGEKAIVIFLICFYKIIDSFSDGYQGLFQLKDRIDIAGMALGIRVIISTISFFILLVCTHSLIIASLSMVIVSVLFVVLFDRRKAKNYANTKLVFSVHSIIGIFGECFPLFLGTFMSGYILTASKYAIDLYLTDEIQSYFGFLLMPAFVINLFSLFVFRPLQTKMAVLWYAGNIKVFGKILRTCLLWIAFLTIGALLGSWFLGIPILNFVSGLDLMEYRIDLLIIMLGGGANALMALFYYVLSVMRKQYWVLIGYTVGFLLAAVGAPLMVKNLSIHGAAISYVVPMIVISLIFACMILCNIKSVIKKKISAK